MTKGRLQKGGNLRDLKNCKLIPCILLTPEEAIPQTAKQGRFQEAVGNLWVYKSAQTHTYRSVHRLPEGRYTGLETHTGRLWKVKCKTSDCWPHDHIHTESYRRTSLQNIVTNIMHYYLLWEDSSYPVSIILCLFIAHRCLLSPIFQLNTGVLISVSCK